MRFLRSVRTLLAGVTVLWLGAAQADVTLLNVAYDVTRELYKDINTAFIEHWAKTTGERISVEQSHGGSSKQALSVASGLEADVVTMNQVTDIDLLARSGVVSEDWRKRLPYNSAPYTSTTIFLVRKGNPKNIRDWDDLAKPGVAVIVPNPKVTGNGRYTYLAAWGYAVKKGGDEAAAREFVTRLFRNVPVLDGGGRGATTTFTQRNMGDVLVTFENEAVLINRELGTGQFDVVYPSISVEAEAPVAVADKVVDKKGTRKQAQAYLEFLYSPAAQEIIARHFYRPRLEAVFRKHAEQFKSLQLFTIDEVFGSWAKAQQTHFADGGVYDQIVVNR
ncbi:MAG: sulfate ABC transporter substrate-binding protein [Candidatus Competibacteraceae bacterium]|nr:sulfate ABC transporter substrate-binding protein [Candidatus Competibacteraceae bacterium]MBK7982459.1 sulfate ABC transporter substrate-binding protein [Candidatus Competibacteraceae bacterium]MBK8898991.1 sulfate ABC transporter substrate-binding protein [Candidatus Competibacteraceae bacterium]MBK8963860.1 sulfate ABC transporter substrate-binding protein [Candidatus Competibacteraceae bacterium]MBK9951996.1 sulfate ABC transporter substrate-binding protein [Candidatus Competibacteraceae